MSRQALCGVACHLDSLKEPEAGGLSVRGQPELHIKKKKVKARRKGSEQACRHASMCTVVRSGPCVSQSGSEYSARE